MAEDYLNDPDFLPIRKAYLDDLRAKAPEMLTAAKSGEYEPVRSFGHNLKGNGTSYGFQSISEWGAEIEQAAIQSDKETLLDRLPRLIDFLETVSL
ncbi:MAG: Hpt domain-containing protein [Lentisphaeria bacterium]|nr:Hpt domain-containing protein [Candidatus Neomarinimicrobiota bacterium]MCF7841741.1 Hpt domain-containing protein [Lentisphaeria bacterium]